MQSWCSKVLRVPSHWESLRDGGERTVCVCACDNVQIHVRKDRSLIRVYLFMCARVCVCDVQIRVRKDRCKLVGTCSSSRA